MRTLRTRLGGLAFLVVLVSLLWLSVAVYQKAFTPVRWVTLRADHTGMQLNVGADVKVRGVIVGEVREVSSDGRRASLRLALSPALARFVPADSSARLLPKTLFGEKFVELVPGGSTVEPIAAGAVIEQDRSATAIELERVLNDLLPLLQAVRPDQLSATLTALASAVEGRGDQIGRTIVNLDRYLAALNREMPAIRDVLRKLPDVLEAYERALPDLLTLLRNLTVTARTVSDQRANLQAFLITTTDLADDTRVFLDRYDARIIQLGEVLRPVLDVLARYAPEYVCLLRGINKLQPRAEQTVATGRLHITLEITRDNGKYLRNTDEPEFDPTVPHGPNCRTLPDPRVPFPEPRVEGTGYDWNASRATLPGLPLVPVAPGTGGQGGGATRMLLDPAMGYAGTAQERAFVKPLVAATSGVPVNDVPDIAVLLWGPLLRGAVVSAR